jgi:predicted transcriptional regulator
MYAREIVSEGLNPLDHADSGEKAIVRMHEYNVNQLPVTDGDKYIGIINMDEIVALRHLNDPIKDLQIQLKRPYVYENAHLFEVMKAGIEYNVKVVPVLSVDEKYIGLITAESCMRAFATLQSVMDEGGIITLSVPVKDFQLSEIARIVESNNATILAYYSHIDPVSSTVDVTLKLNTTELSAIISAFERYEYEVDGVYNDDNYNENMKDNYDALMKYLDV